MFIPLKMVLVGIDPYPFVEHFPFPIGVSGVIPRAAAALPLQAASKGCAVSSLDPRGGGTRCVRCP